MTNDDYLLRRAKRDRLMQELREREEAFDQHVSRLRAMDPRWALLHLPGFWIHIIRLRFLMWRNEPRVEI